MSCSPDWREGLNRGHTSHVQEQALVSLQEALAKVPMKEKQYLFKTPSRLFVGTLCSCIVHFTFLITELKRFSLLKIIKRPIQPYPVGCDATGASPGTQRRVAAARLAQQRTPRTAARPRVPSKLIAATMIQHAYIFMIGSAAEVRTRRLHSTS